MRKHLLIGIPCTLLLMVSFGTLYYAFDAWQRYTYVISNIEAFKPTDKSIYMRALKNVESAEKAKLLAIDFLETATSSLETRHDLSKNLATGANGHFVVFTVLSAISAFLAMVLMFGLAPMFKKKSNKSLNQTGANSAPPD